jgi:hypothetical protein
MSAPAYYPPPAPSRPIGVAILAILVVLIGALLLLVAIGVFLLSGFIALAGLPTFGLAGSFVGVILLIVALLWIGVGLGLWHLRSWAWWLAVIVMVLSILGAIAAPATIVIPLIILIYLVLVRHHFR